jgi:tubulin polyglutamylase TTLL1
VCNTAIVTKTTGLKEDYHKNDVEGEVEEEEFFIDWNLEGLQELLIKEGRISNEMWLDEYLYPRIHRSLIHMVRSTYYTFVRDSRYKLALCSFGEFFAVDFLLDDDLEVWVLEVNYNPQVLAVTPDRILRNFKMVEDTLEIQFAYVRSKYLRLVAYLK